MTPEERARRKLLEEFRRTALDRIARINVLWIEVEQDPGAAHVTEELLRELHTLKGEARMMGFSDVSLLVHRMEEIAVRAPGAGAGLALEAGDPGDPGDLADVADPGELGDLVMDASDVVGQLLDVGSDGVLPVVELSGLLARFDRVLGGSAGADGADADGAGGGGGGGGGDGARPAAPARARAPEPPAARQRPDEDFLRVDVAKVAAFSDATFELRVHARRMTQLARRLVGILADRRAELAELERAAFRADLSSGVRTLAAPERPRGDARRPLAELLGGLSPLCAGLAQEAAASELLLGELDAQVRSLRLVPIATLLERYVRAIRDLAREHGKEVTTSVRDAGVHLDKALLDRLAGPLAHLFRNAIDHGLEGAAERAAAGKPRAGRITLAAEPRAGRVALTIADDGRGIDPERVRARAVELGLVGEAESRALGKSDILQLLFQPGVSTRRTVTETSGRGIGLDAVKREVEHLGGHVHIDAEPGRGTTLELQLPVSVALTRVLVIRLGDLRLGMPSAAIAAVISAGAGELEEVHHRPALRVGDERLSLVDRGALLGRAAALADPVQAIVIGHGGADGGGAAGRRIALAVSGWENDQDVVVKPLGELLASVRLFSGACVLESGALTLVLNPAMVTAQAFEATRGVASAASAASAAGAARGLEPSS